VSCHPQCCKLSPYPPHKQAATQDLTAATAATSKLGCGPWSGLPTPASQGVSPCWPPNTTASGRSNRHSIPLVISSSKTVVKQMRHLNNTTLVRAERMSSNFPKQAVQYLKQTSQGARNCRHRESNNHIEVITSSSAVYITDAVHISTA
jgi:hypothetical protein